LANVEALAAATGGTAQRPYGYTYSDLRQRFVPEVVLTAYRRGVPIDGVLAREVLARTPPTRPFAGVAP
jgi:hypothetical protein